VLQEKSWLLSFPEQQWRHSTYPFARDLRDKIAAGGAKTVLFMTWGYVLGDRWNEPHDTYAAMQARLSSGYSRLGEELGATVAPAGPAWAEALRREPSLELWAGDGEHPSLLGSYLAACVFYGLLSRPRADSKPLHSGHRARPGPSASADRLGRARARLPRSPHEALAARMKGMVGLLTPVVEGLARTLKIGWSPADGA